MLVLTALIMAMGFVSIAPNSLAQTTPSTGTISTASPSDTSCTDFATSAQTAFGTSGTNGTGASGQTGLLSDIYNYVKTVVSSATQNLFTAFTNSAEYQDAIGACFALVVVFYGVGFTMGLVQVSFGDVLKRLIKIGVVAALIAPSGWNFFNSTVVSFFNDGTDQLVETILTIGTGQTIPAGGTPFYQFDQLAAFMLQPQTLQWAMGLLTSGGPYGLMMAGLGTIAFGGFLKLLVDVLNKYAVCYVARSMLLALAPIFFAFLLFDRTKQLFTGWINVLVGMSIRPILMFTFLAFFITLLESGAKDMLSVNVCWTSFQNISGMNNSFKGYRFQDSSGNPIVSSLEWKGWLSCTLGASETSTGTYTTSTGATKSCAEFPVNVIDILTFLILVYIALQFSKNIDGMADELSNSMAGIESSGGAFAAMMRNQSKAVVNFLGKKGE